MPFYVRSIGVTGPVVFRCGSAVAALAKMRELRQEQAMNIHVTDGDEGRRSTGGKNGPEATFGDCQSGGGEALAWFLAILRQTILDVLAHALVIFLLKAPRNPFGGHGVPKHGRAHH